MRPALASGLASCCSKCSIARWLPVVLVLCDERGVAAGGSIGFDGASEPVVFGGMLGCTVVDAKELVALVGGIPFSIFVGCPLLPAGEGAARVPVTADFICWSVFSG